MRRAIAILLLFFLSVHCAGWLGIVIGTAQLQQVIAQIPRSVPVVGKVRGFTSMRLGFGVIALLLFLVSLSTYL